MVTTVRKIGITVTESPPNTFRINTTRDPIDLRGVTGNVQIHWKIKGGRSWRFTRDAAGKGNGITIPKALGKFTDDGPDSPGPGNKGHSWTKDGSPGGAKTYKYSISVTDGTTTLIVDPGIINDV